MIDVLVVGGIFREVLDGDTEPRTRYGGSGLTASVTAARLGVRVALASYVGAEDEAAVRAELRAAGVNDRPVVTVPGASGMFVFPTRQNSERPWPMYRPAEALPQAPPQCLLAAKIIVAFGIPDFDPAAAGWLAGLGTEATLIWDRQGWLSRARDASAVVTLAPALKVYLANDREATEEAGASSIDEALSLQPPPGFAVAVIKRGILGVVVVDSSNLGIQHAVVNSFPVHPPSTIGAGDVFAGAFAARLSKGDSVIEAARWGCAASAVALAAESNLMGDDAIAKVGAILSLGSEHTSSP